MLHLLDVEPLRDADKPLLLIAGATASGKSALALEAAAALGGVIINADSMQVYDAIPILTAQPSAKEMQSAPHRLYGMIPPQEACSAARWADLAKAEIKAVWEVGRVPIVVGGTGLYFRTLLDGIAPIPDIDQETREKVRALAREEGVQAVYEAVKQADMASAQRLEPGDTQRLSRALEVAWSTGKPLSYWQSQPLEGGLLEDDGIAALRTVLERERSALYARCDNRLVSMVEGEALPELKALLWQDVPQDAPILRAVAVPPLRSYLQGAMSLDDAIAVAQRDTRRFAKRQMTWLRQQFSDWHRLSVE